ncbi:hypothetical protein [Actinomadura atramentaria]|uniref:hypothetical protein n=1 Tax=Actinomadura atramentaria TaxID=1990 RepID=UPI0003A5034E|nr:hypothetical protein [Actinomadura atramentaria]
MPYTGCERCGGRGTVTVERRRDVTAGDGRPATVTQPVTEECKGCRGAGVIPR